MLKVALSVAIVALAAGLVPGLARADGDPASDVLTTQALFLPQDAGTSTAQQAELEAVLRAASRSGYQIRVALISSTADLGSVTELWRQPQSYAEFLGQELALVYRGRLLVVMPDGFGLYRFGRSLAHDRSVLAGVLARAGRGGIGAVAIAAIRGVAAAAGRPLPLPAATAPSSSSSNDTVSWIVFAIGSMMIIVAWTASIRARPVRSRERNVST
jgi:hypothetical protein